MSFTLPPESIILQTDHWIVNHNLEAKLPGYLMLSPTGEHVSDFSDLSEVALSSMGSIIARTTKAIEDSFLPEHIFVGRYGVSTGFSLHFHIVPVYGWVKRLFATDNRYDTLKSFYNLEFGSTPDGADWMLYIWRELVESSAPPKIEGPSINEVISILRKTLNTDLQDPEK